MDKLTQAKRKYDSEGIFGFLLSGIRFAIERLYLFTVLIWLESSNNKYINRCGVIVDLTQVTGENRNSLILDYYERAEIEAFQRCFDGTENIIELGSGIGFTSCFIAQQRNETTMQVSVEANSTLISTIENHRNLNDVDFTVLNAAYAPNEEFVHFNYGSNYLGGSLHRNSESSKRINAIDIRTISENFGMNHFALVADIEGSEAELIEAELDYLTDHCSLLIIEFHYDISDEIEAAKKTLESGSFVLVDTTETVGGRFETCVYENTSMCRSSAVVE